MGLAAAPQYIRTFKSFRCRSSVGDEAPEDHLMKNTQHFRFLRLAFVATSTWSLDAQRSSQRPRTSSLSSFQCRHHLLNGIGTADQTRQMPSKRQSFVKPAFSSVPGRPSNQDDDVAILAKYGLQPSTLQNNSNLAATLPGSIRDERRRGYKSFASKMIQLSLIFAASKISDNRIRLGVNIIRWAVATTMLAIVRWYGRLVASSPSELFRRIGHDIIDERGFVRQRYEILEGGRDAARNIQGDHGVSLAVVRQMPGGGSCLFYAVAAGLLESEADKQSTHSSSDCMTWTNIRQKAAELRQTAVDTLEDGPDTALLNISGNDRVHSSILLEAAASSFGMPPKEYCRSMRQPSCWGGGVELVALSNALKRQICMYEPLQLEDGKLALRKIISFGPSEQFAKQPLHVLIANDDFPARYRQQRGLGGGRNHFLAVFPVG